MTSQISTHTGFSTELQFASSYVGAPQLTAVGHPDKENMNDFS